MKAVCYLLLVLLVRQAMCVCVSEQDASDPIPSYVVLAKG